MILEAIIAGVGIGILIALIYALYKGRKQINKAREVVTNGKGKEQERAEGRKQEPEKSSNERTGKAVIE